MDEDLRELDSMFSEIGGNSKLEETANSFDNPADGTYEAEVVSAEYTKSKSDMPMIKIEYALETKQHAWQYLMLAAKDEENTKRQMSRTITVLRKYGLDATSVSGYVSQLDKLAGKGVTITLETKGQYQNIHVDYVQ